MNGVLGLEVESFPIYRIAEYLQIQTMSHRIHARHVHIMAENVIQTKSMVIMQIGKTYIECHFIE